MDDEINYSPYAGEVLPHGNLSIPTFGRSLKGEIWDGRVEVTPEHPSYPSWLSQISNKAAYHAALDEERKRTKKAEASAVTSQTEVQ